MRLLFPAVAQLMAVSMAAELPVREVILYKNGIGFFERSGRLQAGEAARVDFKAAEMNDVLKSLTVEEQGGARITGLRYDASEPLAQRLREFPFQVEGHAPVTAILDQLRGARLELKVGPEALQGTIVGARVVAAGQNQPEREQVLLLVDNGELRTVDLAAASIRLADPKLQTQLQQYLSVVNDSRSKERRSVIIDATSAKERNLVLSYAIPAAAWKSSYRLVLREGADTLLEGWAIVDNTTSDDWDGVHLAVVSGRPVSFMSNLYPPRHVERVEADLGDERAAAPVLYEGAIGGAPPLAPAAPAKPAMRRQAEMQGAVGGYLADNAAASEAKAARRMQAGSMVAINTSERDEGSLFEYRFSNPVTVKHGQSAMLPFVQQKIAARKVLIYSENYGLHPMDAAELTNATGKTLDGGPMAVFDANSYAGEALLETLKAGDKRLISYASDLGTRVTAALDSNRDLVREVHFRRGMLTTRSALQETKTYTIRNVDSRTKTLIIEHPARPGFKVLNQKPLETTAGALRFEVKIPAQTTEKFPVLEEHVYETITAVSNITPDVLAVYVQNKSLPESVRAELRHILDQKNLIAGADAEMRRLQEEASELTRDQDRVRKNITSLRDIPGQGEQVQRYSRQLSTQETQLASLRDRASEVRRKKSTLESELNALLERLEF